MLILNKFLENVTVETPNDEILKLLFKPIKTNNKFFGKIVEIVNKLKILDNQVIELEGKISGLSGVDYMPENRTLNGMRTRLLFLNRQVQTNNLKFSRIKGLMINNFVITERMFAHLRDIGQQDRVLKAISLDENLLLNIKDFKFAWSEVYGI